MKPSRKNFVRVPMEAEERRLMFRYYDLGTQKGKLRREEDNLRAFYNPIC